MTREEFDKIKELAQRLPALRLQVADGQLLDQCEQALHELIAAYESEAEENETRYPAHDALPPEEPPPAPEEATSGMFDARELEPERSHSQPLREVRQKVVHKRPMPRKTHR